MKRFFIFAGERSGDLHGSHLMNALKKRHPEIQFEGVPGPLMRAEKIDLITPMEAFEVMGVSDVLTSLPKLYKQFCHIRNHLLANPPDMVILIDYPGFNLRLAKALRKRGYKNKIVQYISPTVWAHGKERIQEMAKTIDLLLTIYPFETACFKQTFLPVSYVGNPLCEYIKNYRYQKEVGLPPDTSSLIGIFPGSRANEIRRNLPILLEAAMLVKKQHPEAIFGVSSITADLPEMLKTYFKRFPSLQQALFSVPKEYTYELMQSSRVAAAKSGTVTLELALHKCPTVAIYKLTTLNRLYAQYVLKLNLPHYCIVNILAQKKVFPELIESGLSSENLAKHISELYQNGPMREACLNDCQSIHAMLDKGNASQKAAEAILKLCT